MLVLTAVAYIFKATDLDYIYDCDELVLPVIVYIFTDYIITCSYLYI